MHIAIVALGPSSLQYIQMVESLGGRHAYCDQTWVINTYGNVLDHDLVFHMDDVRVQEIRAKANPTGKIARMLEWLKTHHKPVVTSRTHPDYPALEAFPLEAVVNTFGSIYFNNTAAYAIALALFRGARTLSLFGIDFTWPNAHEAEKGRACCEYWLGRAQALGVQLHIADSSTLMDSSAPFENRLYGYDTLHVDLAINDGKARIKFTPKPDDQLPTAAEIEHRYDHSLNGSTPP
jgi:hypothetical protein